MGILIATINTVVAFFILMLADRHDTFGDASVTLLVFVVSLIGFSAGYYTKRRY